MSIKTATLGLVGFAAVVGFVLSSVDVSADIDASVDEINVSVPVSCSVSGAGMGTHNAEVHNGTYTSDIGVTTLHAFCNDNEGFAIYAVGYTGNTIGGADSNKLVGTPAEIGNIVTGTATSAGSPDVSNWAMKLAIIQDSGDTTGTNAFTIDSDTGGSFSSYHAVPNSFTKVAHKNSISNMDVANGGVKLTTTYAVYMAKNQPAGMYNGKVRYTLVHPATNVPNEPKSCNANTICYWPNAGNTVVDTMGDQGSVSASTGVTLWPTNFKRPGYGFAGWSDKYDWVLNENDANGNGTGANAGYHIYGPMQTITFTAGQYTTKGLSLYAVWVPSAGYLQDWTCPNNTTMPISTVTALTDIRDNDTYAVAKLADSNCWMIENLRLDYDAEHNTDGSLAQGYGTSATYGNFIGLAEPETANFSNATIANSLYKSDGSGDIKGINGATLTDIGTTNYPGYRFPRYRNDNTNTDATINPNTTVANMTGPSDNGDYKANIYSYGNYYTWAAAMANTGLYNTTTADADGYTASEAAGTSICPSGWKLPYGRSTGKGATSGGFSYLDIRLGGTGTDSTQNTTPSGKEMSKIWRGFPNNFLYSGDSTTSSAGSRGSGGYYWSSTAKDNFMSYHDVLASHSILPGTGSDIRYRGFSIRCISGS